jgi:hypothetical protein
LSFYKLLILQQALSELKESRQYYNDQVSGLGNKFEAEIFELLGVIRRNPFIFQIKFSNIHEAVLLSFPFVINYEIIGREIIVYAIFHTKRNPGKKSKRRLR